jgi:threonine aldolase
MEMGRSAFISRVIPRPVRSNRGNLDIEEVKKTIRFSRAYTYWGGAVVDRVHLDGARIFNVSVYSGTKFAHSVMFSLSKGLSAPIGIAFTEMVDRLEEDHRKARIFAEGLGKERGVLALAISRKEVRFVFHKDKEIIKG